MGRFAKRRVRGVVREGEWCGKGGREGEGERHRDMSHRFVSWTLSERRYGGVVLRCSRWTTYVERSRVAQCIPAEKKNRRGCACVRGGGGKGGYCLWRSSVKTTAATTIQLGAQREEGKANHQTDCVGEHRDREEEREGETERESGRCGKQHTVTTARRLSPSGAEAAALDSVCERV